MPGETPLTKPEEAFTVAKGMLLLLQTPPPSPLLLSAVVRPAHTVGVPLMVPALGCGMTVTVALAQVEATQPTASHLA